MGAETSTLATDVQAPVSRKCDVFLSFRGDDTRNSFTDLLYAALCQKGIATFRDDEELPKGRAIASELMKAIEDAKISVVVLSEHYASSTWCLKELAKIMECKNESGLVALPVFYNVDPSQVRKQTGSFANDFARHEEAFKDDIQLVQNWRAALTQVGNCSGWDLKDKPQSKVIQEIVEYISSELKMSKGKPNLFIGMDRVKLLESVLGIGSSINDIRVMWICGERGIGKTTIAKVLFNKICNQFEASSFVDHVGDRYLYEKNGSLDIRRQLYDNLLSSQVLTQTVNGLKSGLRSKRVLIVFDDVQQLDQLRDLAGNGGNDLYQWFGPGSRIVITCRDRSLLTGFGTTAQSTLYEVERLPYLEAQALFCQYAFNQDYPPISYTSLSCTIVGWAEGHPLALAVLGSAMKTRDIYEWSSVLEKLGRGPSSGSFDQRKVLDILIVGLDRLESQEKEILFDISLILQGQDEGRVKKIMDSYGYDSHRIIQSLVEKSLLNIVRGKLRMNGLVVEAIGQIGLQEHQEPGKRSRIWTHQDALHVLQNNAGTEAIRGFVVFSPQLQNVPLIADPFLKMDKLRLLAIFNLIFSGCHTSLPNTLRYCVWPGYPLKFLPEDFKPEKLVELRLPQSLIEQLWTGISKPMEKLVTIDLSDCVYLTDTPDLKAVAPNIVELILKGCKRLCEVHSSIGAVERLVLLNLEGCECLSTLPDHMNTTCLETLLLSGCSKLTKLPEISEDMNRLRELDLKGTAVSELPTSVKHLTALIVLNLRDCKYLSSLPEELGSLQSLQELDASGSGIRNVPSSIQLLKSLKVLLFSGCRADHVQAPELNNNHIISRISGISLDHSDSASHYSIASNFRGIDYTGLQLPASFSGLRYLTTLDLSDCNLCDGAIPEELGSLFSLHHLNLSGNNFTSIPQSICQLSRLEELELNNCSKLKSLPKLPLSITSVDTRNCALQGTHSGRFIIWRSGSYPAGIHYINWAKECYIGDDMKLSYPSCMTEVPAWLGGFVSTGSTSTTIPLPQDLHFDDKCKWTSFVVSFVYVVNRREQYDDSRHQGYFGSPSCCHISIYRNNNTSPCQAQLEAGPLILDMLLREKVGTHVLWLRIPRELMSERLINNNIIGGSSSFDLKASIIICDSPGVVEVKACNPRLLFEGNYDVKFIGSDGVLDHLRNPSIWIETAKAYQLGRGGSGSTSEAATSAFFIPLEPSYMINTIISSSSSTAGINNTDGQSTRRHVEIFLARLFERARAHHLEYECRFIMSARPILPWFSHQSLGAWVQLPLPPGLYDDESWIGFTLYVAMNVPTGSPPFFQTNYHLILNKNDMRVMTIEHNITLMSTDEGKHSLCIFNMLRSKFSENLNQCDNAIAFFPLMNGVWEHEMSCGIAAVYEKDLNGGVQTIAHCSVASTSPVSLQGSETLLGNSRLHISVTDLVADAARASLPN